MSRCFLVCADCGCKMKMNTTVHGDKRSYSFNCGDHMRFGKALCLQDDNFIREVAIKAVEIHNADIEESAELKILNRQKAILINSLPTLPMRFVMEYSINIRKQR